MATDTEFIEFVCEQVRGGYDIRYRKMFGEYMVYANDKPVPLAREVVSVLEKITPLPKKRK